MSRKQPSHRPPIHFVEESEPEESVIRKVLRLSHEEARVAALSEEEALEEALRLSAAQAEAQEDVGTGKKREAYEEVAGEERKRQRVGGDGSSLKLAATQASSSTKLQAKPKQSSSGIASIFGSSPHIAPPPSFTEGGPELSTASPEIINLYDGSLDLLYAKGWILPESRRQLFNWMLNELAWHKVTYKRPGGLTITTPRYTTTFGRDETTAPTSPSVYPILPKPLPKPLNELRLQVERLTGAHFNTCIINFYADGKDSISYHSDDERILGRKAPSGVPVPAALPSQKMGTKGTGPSAERPTEKYKLTDGDLVVMRGKTQAEWEHAIPKRASAAGRINITFRRVTSVDGTNNFQRYNRGDGPTLRWRGNRMIEGTGGV